MLIIWHNGKTIKSARIWWRSFIRILDGPVALFCWELIISPLHLMCAIMKLNGLLSLPMKCSGDKLGTLGTSFSAFGPTLTKKSLTSF